MAFEVRKPTPKEIKYLDSFNIESPDRQKSNYNEIRYDRDRNFYLFHIKGSGIGADYSHIGSILIHPADPMCCGIVWNGKPYRICVYLNLIGFYPVKKIMWCVDEVIEKPDHYKKYNELLRIVKEALDTFLEDKNCITTISEDISKVSREGAFRKI